MARADRSELRIVRLAALAGIAGPLLLATTIMVLTLAQLDFLRSLRWHPISAPTTDWPSGLSLGPYGGVMVAAFLISGLLLIVFAAGLDRGLAPGSRLGIWLLAGAGGAMLLLAFKTDPTYRTTPHTWHGILHDLAFVLLGLTLLPAMLILTRRFHSDPYWRGHVCFTLLTTAIILPSFWLKGLAFYIFLGGIMTWLEVTGIRLWQRTRTP